MPKDWPTRDLVCTTLQAFGYGLVGAVSLQNTPVASDMILDTSQDHRSTQKLKQWLLHGFKCKLGPKFGENIEK